MKDLIIEEDTKLTLKCTVGDMDACKTCKHFHTVMPPCDLCCDAGCAKTMYKETGLLLVNICERCKWERKDEV